MIKNLRLSSLILYFHTNHSSKNQNQQLCCIAKVVSCKLIKDIQTFIQKGFRVGHWLWSMYFQVLNWNPKSINPTRMVYQDLAPRVCVVVYWKDCVLVLPIILCLHYKLSQWADVMKALWLGKPSNNKNVACHTNK